jgi:hypothetical protein
MTTIYRFNDEISIQADSLNEAIDLRKQDMEHMDAEERNELLACLQEKVVEEELEDFQEFDAQFHTVEQPEELTESRHKYMLETYGKDETKARLSDPNHIWTIVEGDDNLCYICPGFHYVNRIGYLQTLLPWSCENKTFLW